MTRITQTGWVDTGALAEVRALCDDAGYTVDGVTALLGDVVGRALLRGDLLPARRVLAGDESPLARLARLFILGSPVSDGRDLDPLVTAGLAHRAAGHATAILDLRPYDSGLVVSDLGSDVTGKAVRPDHVLGVGAASVTLAMATPRDPVGSALDIGTGSGVQVLHLATHAASITATDTSERALELARLTFALSGVDAELLRGDLLRPVDGRTFDLIAANPPFVVGPPRHDFDYRDSGRGGDGVTETLVRELPTYLSEGGTAVLLASWLHRRGEPWRERVARWLEGSGCDAWVAQRESADPAEHTALWLADSGGDPDPEEYDGWLTWFDSERVEAVGTGVIALRRTGGSSVVMDEVPEPGAPVSGAEVSGHLGRSGWLREADLSRARLRPGPGVVLAQEAVVGADGWEVVAQLVRAGVRRTGTDAVGVELIGACDGERTVGELLAVLGAAHGFAPADGLAAVTHLVERGVLVPVN